MILLSPFLFSFVMPKRSGRQALERNVLVVGVTRARLDWFDEGYAVAIWWCHVCDSARRDPMPHGSSNWHWKGGLRFSYSSPSAGCICECTHTHTHNIVHVTCACVIDSGDTVAYSFLFLCIVLGGAQRQSYARTNVTREAAKTECGM